MIARGKKSKIVRKRKSIKKNVRRLSKDEDNKRTWKQWVFILAIILFVCTTLYVLFCSSLSRIVNINIEGNVRVDEQEIKSVVQNTITGQLFACIPKNNYFLLNKEKLQKNILDDNRIESVSVEKQFPDTINIEIVEHNIVPIWCSDSSMNNCFLLNDGVLDKQVSLEDAIVKQNEHFVIVDLSNEVVSEGEHIVDTTDVDRIAFLGKELIYAISVDIKQPYEIVSRGSHEVHLKTDEGWYIMIDLTQDPNVVLNTIKLFFQKIQLPSSRIDLEYLDMRFPERIFYKMKDGIEQESEEMSDTNSDSDE